MTIFRRVTPHPTLETPGGGARLAGAGARRTPDVINPHGSGASLSICELSPSAGLSEELAFSRTES